MEGSWFQWIPAVLFALPPAIAIVGNLWYAVGYLLAPHKRHPSMIPLVGGLMGAGFCLLVPIEGLAWYWWVPIVIDPGTGWPIVAFAVLWLTGRLRQSGDPGRGNDDGDPME